MNIIPGIVSSVIEDELFMRIDVSCYGQVFSVCILQSAHENPFKNTGTHVDMIFKESDTMISLHNDVSISCRNRFLSKVVSVVCGPVIARVKTEFNGMPIVSLISAESAKLFKLHAGSDIVCMVKSTSMMLSLKESPTE